ncbi:MAG: FtsX-like permease family protein, partial [Acidimicrobiia bacterium]|nr:FtsX-like permease family protein [Acidimicrobiia bacterium]
RRRELGLLRAVGMTRRQVRASVRWESTIIALFGSLVGIAVGIFFGWSMVRALDAQGITELRLPVGQLVVITLVALGAGVIAAVWPARRAASVDVLRAIVAE